MKPALSTAAVFALSCIPALAQVRVLASNGVRAGLEKVKAQAESEIHAPVDIQFATSAVMRQRIEAGEGFDVAILTTEIIDDLAKAGRVSGALRAAVGRSGIGVGIRAGARKPDIGTAEALKAALLAAKAITYAQDGASRAHLEAMFERLGIAAPMRKKTLLERGSTGATARVAKGDADIVLTLESEIVPAPMVELVGPIPDQFQSYIEFAAAASSHSAAKPAVRALIQFLRSRNLASPAVK